MPSYIVIEHTPIYGHSDTNLTGFILNEFAQYVSSNTFEYLKNLAFSSDATTILNLKIYKGIEQIYFKNYVGILTLPDGTTFEILPKISAHHSISDARQSLLKMLRFATNLPFRNLTNASLHQGVMPLWEVFVRAFLEEVISLSRLGLQKTYQETENSTYFLRGKWLLQRQNWLHKERFLIAYDEFTADILPNQLIKTCLDFLRKRSKDRHNQALIKYLLGLWDAISVVTDFNQKFSNPLLKQTKFRHYKQALEWAEVLLNQHSWGGSGQWWQQSLLFPTEKLFEQYIAQGFKKYMLDYKVIYQDHSNYLIDDHRGKQQFGLRPDLIVKKDNKVLIFDTKWKWIEPTLPNYGIDQADLYQLYAYGQKYKATALYLIYPAHPDFTMPLPPFKYDNLLTLYVIPVAINANLADEIAKIAMTFGD